MSATCVLCGYEHPDRLVIDSVCGWCRIAAAIANGDCLTACEIAERCGIDTSYVRMLLSVDDSPLPSPPTTPWLSPEQAYEQSDADLPRVVNCYPLGIRTQGSDHGTVRPGSAR